VLRTPETFPHFPCPSIHLPQRWPLQIEEGLIIIIIIIITQGEGGDRPDVAFRVCPPRPWSIEPPIVTASTSSLVIWNIFGFGIFGNICDNIKYKYIYEYDARLPVLKSPLLAKANRARNFFYSKKARFF